MEHSEQLDQIAAALAAIQAEVPSIPKDATNPFYKSLYADLPAVMATAGPIVAKHGVAVVQTIGYDGSFDTLTNVVLHTSGQWIADTMRLHLVKDDPQGQGSATTYARRYAYMAALGLVADEDDDGNAASKARRARPDPPPFRPNKDLIGYIEEGQKPPVRRSAGTVDARQAKTRIYQEFRRSGLDNAAAKMATESAWTLGESSISEQELEKLVRSVSGVRVRHDRSF